MLLFRIVSHLKKENVRNITDIFIIYSYIVHIKFTKAMPKDNRLPPQGPKSFGPLVPLVP